MYDLWASRTHCQEYITRLSQSAIYGCQCRGSLTQGLPLQKKRRHQAGHALEACICGQRKKHTEMITDTLTRQLRSRAENSRVLYVASHLRAGVVSCTMWIMAT